MLACCHEDGGYQELSNIGYQISGLVLRFRYDVVLISVIWLCSRPKMPMTDIGNGYRN